MNKPKRAGTAWETAVAVFLRGHGFPLARRRELRGSLDAGDLDVLPGWVVGCKNEKRIELATYMDEIAAQVENQRKFQFDHPAFYPEHLFGAMVVKRRNKPVGRAYVVMELEQFADLIR